MILTPETVTVLVAVIVTLPGFGAFTLIEQLPPVVVQVFTPPTKLALAVLLDRLNVTSVPSGTFTNPVPGFCCTVAVKVCGEFISLVAVSGVIEIFKSTQVLTPLGLSPDKPSPVVRVSGTPLTVTVADAVTVALPAVLLVTDTLQEPAVVVQVLTPPTKVAPAVLFDRLNVTSVPSGAFTNPLPVFCCTVAVNVCGDPTALVAVCGVIEMFKSTHVLLALPLSPDKPSPVVRVRLTPRTLNVVVA